MALLILLPVLLAISAGLSIVFLDLFHRTSLERICRGEALRLQKRLGSLLEQLLKMNRRATQLRVQRIRAEHDLAVARASGNAAAIAAATTIRDAVIVAQTEFGRRQQEILNEARSQRNQTQAMIRAQGARHGLKSLTIDTVDPLAVYPVPPDSLSPNYELQNNFANLQRAEFRYQLNFKSRIPIWLQPSLTRVSLTGACATTLQRLEKKWLPILKTAKP